MAILAYSLPQKKGHKQSEPDLEQMSNALNNMFVSGALLCPPKIPTHNRTTRHSNLSAQLIF